MNKLIKRLLKDLEVFGLELNDEEKEEVLDRMNLIIHVNSSKSYQKGYKKGLVHSNCKNK